MKNKQIDLNNHLFAQLERLSDEDLKGDDLVREINRSKAVTSVAQQLVNNGRLALDVIKTREHGLRPDNNIPEMLEDKSHG